MKKLRNIFLVCALTLVASPLCMAGDSSMPGVQPPDDPPPATTTSNNNNDTTSPTLSVIVLDVVSAMLLL